MTIYIAYGDDGRVGAYTVYSQYANGMTAVEAPGGFDPETSDPTDYVYSDGVMTYDPLPKPQPEPSLDQRVTDVETQLTALGTQVTEADAKADEAKAAADTAAAGMNEYMDALLGLSETDETEATDAE